MTTVRVWLAAGIIGLAAQLALGWAAVPLPEGARVALAFVLLVLWPGAACLLLIGEQPPGGRWLSAGWALALGVTWNALLLSATALLRVPFTGVLAIAPFASAALTGAVALRAGSRPPRPDVTPGLRGFAWALVIAAAAFAALHVAVLGARLTLISDAPDHIGTLRRMLAHGALFPSDAFYRNAGNAGVDPRKSLWHGIAALTCALAHVDPVEAWRDLPVVLAPLFVLNVAALGALVGGGAGAAVSAWVLVIGYGGSLGDSALRDAGSAARMADQLALAACTAALADVARAARGSRLAAVALAAAAVATHVFAGFHLALVLGALVLALAIQDVRAPQVRRLAVTAAAMLVAGAPFALWQVLRTPPALNVLHTEPQGLLWLWDGGRIVSPGVIWDWMGPAWLLIPILMIPLWRARREGVPALFLLTSALIAAVVMFVPPVVGWLEPRLGYLLMRVVTIVPLTGLASWALPRYGDRVLRSVGRARAAAAAMLVLSTLPLVPAALDAMRTPLAWRRAATDERRDTPLPWRRDLARADSLLGPGHVVLSDPVTSYSIPMLTRQYVVTMLDQHSPPCDPNAVRRLVDSRDALDPYAGWERTRAVLSRYGADVIVLNNRFHAVPAADYWSPRPQWFASERARLDAHPEAFVPVIDHPDFVVYRARRSGLDALAGAPPERPYVVRFRPGDESIGHRMGPGLPEFLGLSIAPAVAAPGDTVAGQIRWRGSGADRFGSYQVVVRFDRALPWGVEPPGFVSKPVRKLIEHVTRHLYRFRDAHLPVAGDYGVDLWQPDQVVRDSFRVVVPRSAAPGSYVVRVRMNRQPHYPNLHLRDYFYDQDAFAGVVAGQIGVAPPPGSPPSDRDLAPRGALDVRH